MSRFRTLSIQVEVKAPVDEVFGYLADLRHLPEWDRGVESVSQNSEGSVGLGSTFRGINPKNHALGVKYTITDYIANQRVAFEIKSAGMQAHTIIETYLIGEGTRVRQTTFLDGASLLSIFYVATFVLTWPIQLPFVIWGTARTRRRLRAKLESLAHQKQLAALRGSRRKC